jgi:RND family efflux transporter MFP subunit
MDLKTCSRIVLIVAVSSLHMHCGNDTDAGSNGNGLVEKVTDVRIMTLAPTEFIDYIEVTGKVNAEVTSTVSAEEAGVIERYLKDKGDLVKKGEEVVRLESKVLQASADEANASYLLSKATYERQANLYQDNVISEQQYLQHKYSLDRDRARYDNLLARLAKTRIKSPVTGKIDQKLSEIGEFVMPGKPLFKVVKTDIVKIFAGVPEKYIQDVVAGSGANISFDVLPGEEFIADVTFVGPSIDASSRTFPIEIALKNKSGILKPEMFANIRIKKAERQDVVVVGRDAIIETEAGKYAFIEQGGIAARKSIEIGGSFNNRIWVKSGLSIGDRLIVVGHRDLVDGEKVAVSSYEDSN